MKSLKELQEQRVELAKAIQELASRQDTWTAEDREHWDNVNTDYDATMRDIDSTTLANECEARKTQVEKDAERVNRPPTGMRTFNSPTGPTAYQRAQALQAWVCHTNELNVTPDMERAASACGINFRSKSLDISCSMRSPIEGHQMFSSCGSPDWSSFERGVKARDKMLQRMDTGTPTEGAEFVPELFQYELERAMLAYGGFRQVARILPTPGGNPLKWPTVDDTGNVAVIVDENASIGSDTPATTGAITFGAYKYSSQPVIVSQELIEDSAFDMASLLGSLLGERLGRGEAAAFATGDGTAAPQGIVTGSTLGTTATAADAITADELIDLQHSLDPAYRALPSVGFAFNDSTLGAIRKLQDANEQYLWQPGLQLGAPDMLLGSRYTVVQEMPDIATSAKPVLFGAMAKFVIREVASYRFYTLNELYRANDQTGFVAMHRVDSKVIQPGAIKHLVMAGV